MKHYVPGNAKPELVIALAAPLGSDTSLISAEISNGLKAYGYVTEPIRVSDLIAEWCSKPIRDKLATCGEDVRINALMNAGDILRQSVDTGAATVPLICAEIRRRRQKFLIGIKCHDEYDSVELYNSCFLINSLKHPDEVDILRKVYGDKLIVVSVFTSEDNREAFLSKRIAKSYKSPTQKKYNDKSCRLIDKDRQRLDTEIGQNISDTFPLADFFLRGDRHARSDAERLLEIIFGNQKVTPTRLEYAMFEARANALRSADLSRQVGAVVTTPTFDIIARGCNEVPVAGGGVYWHEDGHDKLDTRDVASGQDFNALKKIEVLK